MKFLTVSTRTLKDVSNPEDVTYFFNSVPEARYIRLRHIELFSNVTEFAQCLYVHCSILNKDDNELNGDKSDVLAVVYCDVKRDRITCKLQTNPKAISYQPSYMRLYLTNALNKPLHKNIINAIIYEFEFS